jgi:hypothetical protein
MMRIDREAFLLAVAALAGCERADVVSANATPVTPVAAQRPAVAMPLPLPPSELQPPAPSPVLAAVPAPPAPTRVTVRPRLSVAKRWFLGLAVADRNNVTSVCQRRAEESCQAAVRALMPRGNGEADASDPPSGQAPLEPDAEEQKVARLETDKLAAYCRESIPAPTCETPLVVAFEGQPVDFAPADGALFAFVPGEPAATDWPTAATPWIALDLDGDGAITGGRELFGSSTVLPNGARAVNGFVALAALDANGDGVLDARDPMFSRLVLWTDRNGDHRSSPDELRPLADTVSSISLAFSLAPQCNQRDDCEGERAALHWRDAAGADHVGAVVDVYLPRHR